MTDEIIRGVVTIATAIIGVAILSVIVSRNAQTPAVIQAAGGSFAQMLGAAVSPVTGGSGAMMPLGVSGFNSL